MKKSLVPKVLTTVANVRRSSAIGMFMGAIVCLFLAHTVMAAEPVRVTTSFDAKYAPAVLRQVSRLFTAGFGSAEVSRVEQDIAALKADQPKAWQFTVEYKGKSEPLEVRALMDDLGMIDLDFSASPDAAPALRAAVDNYLNSRRR